MTTTIRPLLALAWLLAATPIAAGVLHDGREVHLSDVRQLTFAGENAEAYWSGDGTQLVFQSTRPPYACDQIFALAVGDLLSGKVADAPPPRRVSTGKGRTTCAYFLRGDRQILYASTDGSTAECPKPPDRSQGYVWPIDPDYELFVTEVATGERRRWTENRAYDAEATVCSTNGAIVFTSTRDGDLDLYRMDSDGSNVTRLTNVPGYDGGAFFSADCSKLVWRASRPQGADLEDYRNLLAQGLVRPSKLELWVADGDGGNARQVTDLGAASFAPFFFPDGRRILFSTNHGDPRGREFDIWAIDVDGSDLERITFTPGFDGFPVFSPDGKWLAFGSNRNQGKPGETDVYIARWTDAPVTGVEERAADRFAADAAWLADDAREGRGIGTRGLAEAGAWIERRFRELGLAPAGTAGSYRQEFPVTVAVRSTPETRLSVQDQDQKTKGSIEGKDEDGEATGSGRRHPGSDNGPQTDAAGAEGADGASSEASPLFVPLAFSSVGSAAGELVAAGFGISAPELGHDDYSGIDVRGKVVLVRRFVPSLEAFSDANVERRWSDLRLKAFAARERGAVAMLVVDYPLAGPDGAIVDEAALPRLSPDDLGDAGIPVLAVRRSVLERLERAAGSGSRVEVAVGLEREQATAFNVVARLDPETPSPAPDGKVVVVGAHYDHLGKGGQGSFQSGSEEIHNGADDNASGVAAVLEAARALAARRGELARPVVFVAFAGEERGLLGSAYLVRNPPAGLEPERIAAMVNLDMVGRLRDQTLTVLGSDSAAEWSSLVDAACADTSLTCRQQGDAYGPSDQTSFYAVSVPVLHLFTGTHDQYHRPADDADLLNATGGARVAALTAGIAARVANRDLGLTVRRAESGPPPRGDARSFGASLGTVPDYAGPGDGIAGVLLAGTRPGGPAERAGMRRGDLLVELAGREIRDLNDLMYLLRAAHPGESALAVVVRDGTRVELEVIYSEPRRM